MRMNSTTAGFRMCYIGVNTSAFQAKDNFEYRKSSACRRLFNDQHIDREETVRDLRQVLQAFQCQQDQRWNFNFRDAEPLTGRFEWSVVPSQDYHGNEMTPDSSTMKSSICSMDEDNQKSSEDNSLKLVTTGELDRCNINFKTENRLISNAAATEGNKTELLENIEIDLTSNHRVQHRTCDSESENLPLLSTNSLIDYDVQERLLNPISENNLSNETCSDKGRVSRRVIRRVRNSRRKDMTTSALKKHEKQMKRSSGRHSRITIKTANIKDYFPVSKKCAMRSSSCSSGKNKSTTT